jgi:hypothetical protein
MVLRNVHSFHLPVVSSGRTGVSSSAALKNSQQLLEFQEPTTGVTVRQVGAMHYNPASIQLTADTIHQLASSKKLGSIIIESCDIRWNSTMQMNPILTKALNSEMRTAYDLAMHYQRPVILGDQRINVTASRLGAGLKETIVDIINPFAWNNIARVIDEARKDALPLGSEYLGPSAILEPKLLLASPISFIKYPISFFVKSPVPFSLLLGLLLWSESSVDLTYEMTVEDWIVSIFGAFLETVIFARLFLREMLAQRNEILALNILDQCKMYQKRTWPLQRQRIGRDFLYAPGSVDAPQFEQDKTVVAGELT